MVHNQRFELGPERHDMSALLYPVLMIDLCAAASMATRRW